MLHDSGSIGIFVGKGVGAIGRWAVGVYGVGW